MFRPLDNATLDKYLIHVQNCGGRGPAHSKEHGDSVGTVQVFVYWPTFSLSNYRIWAKPLITSKFHQVKSAFFHCVLQRRKNLKQAHQINNTQPASIIILILVSMMIHDKLNHYMSYCVCVWVGVGVCGC